MQGKDLEWDVGGLPLGKADTYAYRRNIAMLIDAGLSYDEIKEAANDLYDEEKLGGVYLDNNKQKVWVITNQNRDERKGYEIYAQSLKITTGDDDSFWEWKGESESRGCLHGRPSVDINVAYVKAIKWLEVRGKLSTIKLTACTKYKVYVILKTATIDGRTWDQNLQVTFRLCVPNMGRQENQQTIKDSSVWEKYFVGEFFNDQRTVGTIEFHMEQLENIWKQGLVIKGVRFEPEPFSN